ncbi:TPA: hypothetical protein ACRZZI_004973 [Vibrio harveyi]
MANKNLYKPEYAEQCYKLCLLGLTDRELGKYFGVDHKTIRNWADKYPEFGKARSEGKDFADAEVAQALYKRAKGGLRITKQKVDKDGNVYDLQEELPADVKAAETWLSSRRGKRDSITWNPKQEIEHSGSVQADLGFILEAVELEAEDESPLAHGGTGE